VSLGLAGTIVVIAANSPRTAEISSIAVYSDLAAGGALYSWAWSFMRGVSLRFQNVIWHTFVLVAACFIRITPSARQHYHRPSGRIAILPQARTAGHFLAHGMPYGAPRCVFHVQSAVVMIPSRDSLLTRMKSSSVNRTNDIAKSVPTRGPADDKAAATGPIR